MGFVARLRFPKGVRGFAELDALFRWLCLEILAEIICSLITHGKHLQFPGEFYSFMCAASRVHALETTIPDLWVEYMVLKIEMGQKKEE